MTREVLLIVYGPNFTAGAVITKNGEWQWTRVAPIIGWFRYRTVRDIGRFLKGPAKKSGWTYEVRSV